MECKYFNEGRCNYGNNCRYPHVVKSSLLDPPSWLLTGYTENNTHILGEFSYSFEEVRYSYYLAKREGEESLKNFFIQWNSMLMQAHTEYSNRITSLFSAHERTKNAKVGSPSGRPVDLRDPDTHHLFIQPVDVDTAVFQSINPPPILSDPYPLIEPLTGHADSSTAQEASTAHAPHENAFLSEEEYLLGEIPMRPPR
ncbi:hypothetical protein NEFER03_1392 [Nematocida sp. LUAm3]|nr:hypothetical protein NEFER03_1392 [Nematocida sp. LUAm3]KAI5174778.1 hypothetical protein NEFER02_0888 [Nematocida sp. LUAm2]KAI5177811.1 hypothetical protein NEFER01_1013 [Nematocida sp. LUAm1]